MNLSGNKIIAASALFLAVNLANAEAPDLVEFTAGTAAKAAEVNSNFDDLKTYSESLETVIDAQAALITALEGKATTADTARAALEEKVTALETKSTDLQSQISSLGGDDGYTIAVYGDNGDEPIGLTNAPKISNDKQYMILKTPHGMATLVTGQDEYILRDYDPLSDDADSNSIHYSDALCNNPVSVLGENDIGNSMLFTKEAGVLDTPKIATNEESAFLAEAGTEFSNVSISFYSKDSTGECVDSSEYVTGSIYIPVVEMTEALHNLKHSYTSIRLEGYQTN